MLVDSDGELENIFDDRLRISKVKKNRGVLGDRTNQQQPTYQTLQNILKPSEETGSGKENINLPPSSLEIHKKNPPDFDFILSNADDKLYFSYEDKKQSHESRLANIDKELESLINRQTFTVSSRLKNKKYKTKDVHTRDVQTEDANLRDSNTQTYLNEIEREFQQIRLSHRKMLATRNKILKMVEREIEITRKEIEKEKNKEIKKLERTIKDLRKEKDTLEEKLKDVTTNPEVGLTLPTTPILPTTPSLHNTPSKVESHLASTLPDLLHNYQTLESKYADQAKEMESLKGDNLNLKKQVDTIKEKYSRLKVVCKQSILQYKLNLDSLYLSSIKNIKKKYKG